MSTKAYKLGFNDGYFNGVENNPFKHERNFSNKYYEYVKGYNEGVSEYCREEE
jgi:hypothetical protein